MSEIKDGNIIIGVPERIEKRLKTKKNYLCCKCETKETIIYRTDEEFSFNSVTKKTQPLVKVTKDKDDVYHIKLFNKGEDLKTEIEYFINYPPIADSLTGFPELNYF
ncbi:MAG: hypothetical protein WA139_00785 [Candidatus Aenigmatarchaeota archaeon]